MMMTVLHQLQGTRGILTTSMHIVRPAGSSSQARIEPSWLFPGCFLTITLHANGSVGKQYISDAHCIRFRHLRNSTNASLSTEAVPYHVERRMPSTTGDFAAQQSMPVPGVVKSQPYDFSPEARLSPRPTAHTRCQCFARATVNLEGRAVPVRAEAG